MTSQQVKSWLRDLKLSPQSINNYRTRLGSLCNYAVENGYMDRNPVDSIDTVKKVDKPVEILSVDELARLLGCAEPEALPTIAIGAFAGVRTAELLRLHWKDVDLARGFLNVGAEESKSARRRLIKMETCLVAWLSPYAGKTGPILPVNVFQYLHLVRQTCKAAGIAKWPKNGLRH